MRERVANIAIWLKLNEKKAVLSGIFIFGLLISAACLWKYAIFAYNGIDLAYFSQVFWNTVHGRLFMQSIHPHLSLGDHAEFAILPLSLIYAPFRDPRALLVLQAFALAACAWPVWRIARFRMASQDAARMLPFAGLLFAGLVLLNPSLQNIGLFEFHVLAFAAFPLLMAMLAYEVGDKKRFLLWCAAALLVREDVAMVVAMIGLLAWMERKALWWRIVPFVGGCVWFVAAMRVIAHFSPDGGYKFKIYYAWLGSTPLEMLSTPFLHPLVFLGHLCTLANLEMVIGFLMPLAFLPLLKPRRLLLAVGPFLQIILGAPGGGELVLQTHYATLFLPALFLAAVDGAVLLPALLQKILRADMRDARGVAVALLAVCGIYGAVVMGPLPAIAASAVSDRQASVRAARYRELLAKVPADASVAASYSLLAPLSSREHLTSLHYVALGVLQFAEKPYEPPANLRMVALDADDLVTYRAQFLHTAWAEPHYAGLEDRLEAVLGTPIFADGTVALYDRESIAQPVSWSDPLGMPPTADARAFFADSVGKSGVRKVQFEVMLGQDVPPEGSVMHYRLIDAKGRLLTDDVVPIDAPAPWTSRNGGTTVRMSVSVPDDAVLPLTPSAEIVVSEAMMRLDSLRSAVRSMSGKETIWRTYDLPKLESAME